MSLLVSWGSLYYSFTVLAGPMQKELQCSAGTVAGAFSFALLVWGMATYPVGRALNHWGGRAVMSLGSLFAVAAFLGLHSVSSVWAFYALWGLLGAAMALTLYEPAFAVIVQSFSAGHRRRIGWLTIVGGMASTIFWPLSHYLDAHFGWREAALAFAALHFFVCVPLHLSLPRGRQGGASERSENSVSPPLLSSSQHTAAFTQLAACFTIYGFVTAAMAVQVIPALESLGLDAATALALAACIGPAQAAGRALDFALGERLNVRRIGMITLSLMPLSLAALWLAQWLPILCIVFVIAYGLSLGLLTVIKAMAPLALSGTKRYARNSGALSAPAVVARAAGPLGAAWLLATFGGHGPLLLALLAASAFGSWMYLRAWPRESRIA